MLRRTVLAAVTLGALVLSGLSAMAQSQPPLKIGVSAGPYGDILRFTADLAAKEGLKAEIVEFSDWVQINEALNRGDLDANNFQHIPYLQNQVKQRGYDIVPLDASIVVPMGLYSKKFKSAADLPKGAQVAIPNDPSNASRALFLLQQAGLIKLKADAPLNATLIDIAENPRGIKLIELDAAQLPRSLDDVAAATVTLNYAVLAGLKPKESITLENEQSKWHLVWAARKDRKDDPRIKRFIALYRSQPVKDFINARFEGTIIPTW
ncbi:MetQ/NlpA family ABC transporter substrate-binding protein [uncultured Ferrovibrio sp.]|jgi:D-methionine transport system substrate-binding protein|uniref:MetQ/NlpA family ABC transporter substrate-binding protein n=1 Tax=uncultured Ferrovibrio sp. TaxID=1576913 RepID=UPI00260F701A|nr:MetQ/NlpA family ABC transporter substrate-binding protein [uncultured Ferrovibrio sp.]